jgi:hypothetical protein
MGAHHRRGDGRQSEQFLHDLSELKIGRDLIG